MSNLIIKPGPATYENCRMTSDDLAGFIIMQFELMDNPSHAKFKTWLLSCQEAVLELSFHPETRTLARATFYDVFRATQREPFPDLKLVSQTIITELPIPTRFESSDQFQIYRAKNQFELRLKSSNPTTKIGHTNFYLLTDSHHHFSGFGTSSLS